MLRWIVIGSSLLSVVVATMNLATLHIAVRDINANFQTNHPRCTHCNGILRAISISPLDPCVPYCYDADKNKISVDTYICEKCGNIVGRKRLDE